MRFNEHQSLQSEVKALELMLSEIPEDDVLDRRSIEARLAAVRSLLPDDLTLVEKRERVRAALTFRGRPVVGTHGILADFGAKATAGFSEAVAAIAASLTAPLKSSGPIPDKDSNQLLITGVAVGSFGFELEEARPASLLLDHPSKVEVALQRAVSLLGAMVSNDDELLADNIEDLDQRALSKVREFVKTLSENEATCAVAFQKSSFSFPNIEAVRRGLDQISGNNIAEKEEFMTGTLLGILPNRRSFEFKDRVSQSITHGKISPAIEDPQFLNQYLQHEVTIQVVKTQIRDRKPRYVLRDIRSVGNDPLLEVAPI